MDEFIFFWYFPKMWFKCNRVINAGWRLKSSPNLDRKLQCSLFYHKTPTAHTADTRTVSNYMKRFRRSTCSSSSISILLRRNTEKKYWILRRNTKTNQQVGEKSSEVKYVYKVLLCVEVPDNFLCQISYEGAVSASVCKVTVLWTEERLIGQN